MENLFQYNYGDLLIKKRALGNIFKALKNNDFNYIKDNYPILVDKYQSLKVIVDSYMVVREESYTAKDDLLLLMNAFTMVQYLKRELTNDDIDTISYLIRVFDNPFGFEITVNTFKYLFILIYKEIPLDWLPNNFLGNLDHSLYCFSKSYKKVKMDGLKIDPKVLELISIFRYKDKHIRNLDDEGRNALYLIIVYCCLKNDFTCIYNLLKDPYKYLDYISFNGYSVDDLLFSYDTPKLLEDMEIILNGEKNSDKLIS